MFLRLATFGMAGTVFVLVAHWIVVTARRSARPRLKLRWWQWVAADLPVVGVLLGVFTAFGPLWKDQELRGWWLLAHVALAPILILGLVVAALSLAGTFSHAARGTASADAASADDATATRMGGAPPTLAHRAAYWLMLTLGVVAVGAMLVSMLPWAGQSCLNDLVAVHRYSSVALVMATFWFSYLSLTRR